MIPCVHKAPWCIQRSHSVHALQWCTQHMRLYENSKEMSIDATTRAASYAGGLEGYKSVYLHGGGEVDLGIADCNAKGRRRGEKGLLKC